MHKMKADRTIAVTSLLTLALFAAPHVACAEELAMDGQAAAPVVAEQVAQDEAATDAVEAVEPEACAVDGQAAEEALVANDAAAPEAGAEGLEEGGAYPLALSEPDDVESYAASAEAASAQQGEQDSAASEAIETPHGIPVLTIYVDESEGALAQASANDPEHSYGGLGEMSMSQDHSVRCIGSVEFTVPDGFTSEYGPATTPSGRIELKYLRGRGNSTWGCDPKKAYKIAFKDKQELFGMPKNKEWALLSSPWDHSMIRNRITYWLESQKGGSEWVPRLVPVDLVIVGVVNGHEVSYDELGCYYLSEFVEVKKGRLELDVPDADVTSEDPADEDNITGDYLLSIYSVGQNGDEPINTVFNVDSGITFINHSPEFEDGELTEGQVKQCNYIRDYVRELDRLIMAPGEIDAERHAAIAEMMDLDAAADYWWLQEFSNNDDGFRTSSNYLYKRKGGKLVWGPVWDFDVAWNESATHEGFDHTGFRWFDKLRWDDPYFVALLKERWNDPSTGLRARVIELTRDGSALDRYRDEIAAAGDANAAIWGYDSTEERSTADVANQLKKWLGERVAWVDENLDSIGCESAELPSAEDHEFGEDGTCEKPLPVFVEKKALDDGSLGVQFTVMLPDNLDASEFEDAVMEFKVGAWGDTIEVPMSQAKREGKYRYVFTCPLNCIQMADTITATYRFGGGQDVSDTATMRDCIDAYVSAYGNGQVPSYLPMARIASLYGVMADYGHYSQSYLSVLRGWKLGKDHVEMPATKEYTERDREDARAAIADRCGAISCECARGMSASVCLVQDSKLTLSIVVRGDKEVKSVTVDGEVLPEEGWRRDGDRWVITLAPVQMRQVGDAHKVVVSGADGEALATIDNVSPVTYAGSVLGSKKFARDDDARNAMVALYDYCEAVMAL